MPVTPAMASTSSRLTWTLPESATDLMRNPAALAAWSRASLNALTIVGTWPPSTVP